MSPEVPGPGDDHPAKLLVRDRHLRKTYKLRVPKDVPAKQFWSSTVYDRATWAFINNPLDRAGLGSFNKDQMKLNAFQPDRGRRHTPKPPSIV